MGRVGDWYKIKIENHYAYVSKPLISDSQVSVTSRGIDGARQAQSVQSETLNTESSILKTVYVNAAVANMRSGPSTQYEIVTTANRKQGLEVVAEENGWYKVKLASGIAYILKTLTVDDVNSVVVPTTPVKIDSGTSIGNGTTSQGEAVVNYAKQFLGCRYSYGGAGPSSFDCSGFTQYVYKQFGVSLAHSAVTQNSSGTAVTKANLQLGDIIIFNDSSNSSIGHCGIYVGSGKFIHAANPSRGVVIDTFTSGYYNVRYVSARRVI